MFSEVQTSSHISGFFDPTKTGMFILIYLYMYTLKNERLKITQLEKTHFIKVNELKLSQIELF